MIILSLDNIIVLNNDGVKLSSILQWRGCILWRQTLQSQAKGNGVDSPQKYWSSHLQEQEDKGFRQRNRDSHQSQLSTDSRSQPLQCGHRRGLFWPQVLSRSEWSPGKILWDWGLLPPWKVHPQPWHHHWLRTPQIERECQYKGVHPSLLDQQGDQQQGYSVNIWVSWRRIPANGQGWKEVWGKSTWTDSWRKDSGTKCKGRVIVPQNINPTRTKWLSYCSWRREWSKDSRSAQGRSKTERNLCALLIQRRKTNDKGSPLNTWVGGKENAGKIIH